MQYGFVKVAAATPRIKVANPYFNAERALDVIQKCADKKAIIIVLQELSLTGATSNDLLLQDILIKESKAALEWLAKETAKIDSLILVGLPWKKGNRLFNVAAALNHGKVLALIPQTKVPNYGDRDGLRYFSPAEENLEYVSAFGYDIPFGNKILLQLKGMEEVTVACEIGEDLFAINPPAQNHVMAGATIIANLFAGGEMVSADEYRKTAVVAATKRMAAGYVMSGAGEGESTQDLVFFGHKLIAENGNLLAEAFDYEEEVLCQDIDVYRLMHERVRKNTFENQDKGYITVNFRVEMEDCSLDRKFSKMPFIPQNEEERKKRLADIFRIQASGLKKRLAHTYCEHAILGISGGLDSTLALLVTAKAFDMLGIPRNQIRCVTMPCFGTTDRTYDNACKMTLALGAVLEEVDIKESVSLHFRDIKHDKDNHNVTYENSQARERTQVLMDIANRENGMVIGNCDMSELALGWATYNGDHMSMYGVNGGVPKTLVRYLVKYYADTCQEKELRNVLLDVLDTPVSPELLPPVDGVIAQKTEDLVGPYELHDFFLYYMLRFGYEPAKIYRIAVETFEGEYDKEVIMKWLKTFCRRFFTQQFKRSCLPDGPKVGSVSVSPRGDLRMPSDAVADIWLRQLEAIES